MALPTTFEEMSFKIYSTFSFAIYNSQLQNEAHIHQPLHVEHWHILPNLRFRCLFTLNKQYLVTSTSRMYWFRDK